MCLIVVVKLFVMLYIVGLFDGLGMIRSWFVFLSLDMVFCDRFWLIIIRIGYDSVVYCCIVYNNNGIFFICVLCLLFLKWVDLFVVNRIML